MFPLSIDGECKATSQEILRQWKAMTLTLPGGILVKRKHNNYVDHKMLGQHVSICTGGRGGNAEDFVTCFVLFMAGPWDYTVSCTDLIYPCGGFCVCLL